MQKKMTADPKKPFLNLNELKSSQDQIEIKKETEKSESINNFKLEEPAPQTKNKEIPAFLDLSKINQPSLPMEQKETIPLEKIVQEEKQASLQIKKEEPKKVIEKKKKVEDPIQTRKKKRRIFLLIILLITALSFGFLYIAGTKKASSFYIGNWSTELTANEKSAGIEKINVSLDETSMLQDLKSLSQGLTLEATLKFDLKILEKTSNTAKTEISNMRVESLKTDAPLSLCPGEITKCTSLKEKFETEFRKNIEEQSKAKFSQKLQIKKLSADSIQLEFETEGTKLLRKIKS